jgi:predicted phosphodiesterase
VLACLYDVHGNLPALEAVLEDASAAGARQWILGGDYASFGAWPAECVQRLRDLDGPAVWIRGNWERWAAHPEQAPDDNPVIPPALAAVRGALDPTLISVLDALPPDARYGEDTLICHGAPGNDTKSILAEPAPEDDVLLAGVPERRILLGHTHLQFRRDHGEYEIVNPGSVGMPFDGDHRAAYALIDSDGALELRRVAYDHASVAARLREIGEPWADATATIVEQARFVV